LPEPEITSPTSLCTSSGDLDPAATGWTRRPLHTCNLSRHWPRKKRWNYWCVTDGRLLFSFTLADIDYLGLAFVYAYDRETGDFAEETWVRPLGWGIDLPDAIEASITFASRSLELTVEKTDSGYHARIACKLGGRPLQADLDISVPESHESLGVVIPWSQNRFQFTSKQNTLPATGRVTWGDLDHALEDAFATLDYGRGVWKYACTWNWASTSTRADGHVVGVNLGGQWTDGTGMTENALCLDGRLTKLHEDMRFQYDRDDWLKPWRLVSSQTDAVDLTFTPCFDRQASINLVALQSQVHQLFGTFAGRLRFDGGEEVEIADAFGWAEEHVARW
jgi:hypothetical protein